MMALTDHDPEVPEDLAAGLRRAAAAVPDADLHPSRPVERLRVRRRRQRLTGVGVVAVAVLATVGVVYRLTGDHAKVEAGDPSQSTEPTSPSEEDGATSTDGNGTQPIDGTDPNLPKAQSGDYVHDAVRLSDGRLVTLAVRDLDPDGEPEDFGSDDAATIIATFDQDDNLVGQGEVPDGPDSQIVLAGEFDGKVAAVRTTGIDASAEPHVDLSVIDPTTFEETQLDRVDAPEGSQAQIYGHRHVSGGRLVFSSDHFQSPNNTSSSCYLTAVDLTSMESSVATLSDCGFLAGIAVSPDGRHAAVTGSFGDLENLDDGAHHLIIVDLASMEIVDSADLGPPTPCTGTDGQPCEPSFEFKSVRWAANDTVEVGLFDAEGPNPEPPYTRTVTHTID